MSDQEKTSNPSRNLISRRNILKIAAITAAGLAAKKAPRLSELPPMEPEYHLQLTGEEQAVNIQGLVEVPDTRTSYINNGSDVEVYLSAGRKGYRVSGPSLDQLGQPVEILRASGERTEFGIENYNGPSAVLAPFEDPNHKLMFYHGEYHKDQEDGGNFTAFVGFAESFDGGTTWDKKGPILTGIDPEPAGRRVSGAGQPSALIVEKDGQVQVGMYFTQWIENTADAIYFASCPIENLSDKSAWQVNPEPVIARPNEHEGYAGNPAVAWHQDTNNFFCVFETNYGFWTTQSKDGLVWDQYQKIREFEYPKQNTPPGEVWRSYPTLISPETPNNTLITNHGFLINSKGSRGGPVGDGTTSVAQSLHTMVKTPFEVHT